MLTVHHLGVSQSERIVWLCEELGLPYELKIYDRDAVTRLAPPEYKALHPLGAAPVIEDGDVLLAESGAIVEYIVARYGKGRLVLAPDHPDFAQFLYWFHFANGTLQPATGRNMILGRLDLPADNALIKAMKARLDLALGLVEAQLPAVRPRALSGDPRLSAAHRRPAGLPAGDAQGRSRDASPPDLKFMGEKRAGSV